MSRERCAGIVTSGFGIRYVGGCEMTGTEEIDGRWWCREHASEQRYQHQQFTDMMAKATRHSRQTGVHGKGVRCLCGEFVPDGVEHPWGVPDSEEDAWWAGRMALRVPADPAERRKLYDEADLSDAERAAVESFLNSAAHPPLPTQEDPQP